MANLRKLRGVIMQSKYHSFIEVFTSMVSGYLITIFVLSIIPPMNHHTIAALFVILGLLKNYIIRRIANLLQTRRTHATQKTT